MPDVSLATFPADIAARIAENLAYSDQLALLQTCKSLCDATRQARRNKLLRDAQRPGRISCDPFPTMLEFVRGGAGISYWKMNIPAILRETALLQPKPGILQAAQQRRAVAMDIMLDTSNPLMRGKDKYCGQRDAQNRPHGVGLEIAGQPPKTAYVGDWAAGKREGYGTQFYSGPRYFVMAGGWYEGHWRNDMPHGLGMHVEPDLSFKEGIWNNGHYMGATETLPMAALSLGA